MYKIEFMELQTVVKLEQPEFRFGYLNRLMMIGSCFVENMGEKLTYYKFQADVNPCGIVYNPVSVATTLRLLLDGKHFTASDLVYNNGQWVSLWHHGRFSAPEATDCLQKINERLDSSRNHLKKTDVLIITWGTSWIYRYRRDGSIVSNCHKLPSGEFERSRLEVKDIVELYRPLLGRLRELRPELRVLFTVSPIRHWKDGAHGNQLSKAVLLLAIDELCRSHHFVSYFPSYEIVMDELRDYRFYADDMLHISPQGINYIWEKFSNLYIDESSRRYMPQIDRMNKILEHRLSDVTPQHFLDLRARTEHELLVFQRYLRIHSSH